MLVPGLGCQIGDVVFPDEQVQVFVEAGFRVVRVDCRDAGLSTSFDALGRPDLEQAFLALSSGEVPVVPYTHLDMADDLLAVADDMGASRVHLVGASAGGFLVRWAAIRQPQRVETITVVMSGSGGYGDDDAPEIDLEVVLPVLVAVGDRRTKPDHIDFMVELWGEQWGTVFPLDEGWVTERATLSFERSYRPDGALRQLFAGMGTPGLWDAQRSIEQPVLVVHGSSDTVFASDHGAATAAQIPNADLWLVEGMGHSMPVEIWPELTQRISVLTGLD